MLSTLLGNWRGKSIIFSDAAIITMRDFAGSSNPSQEFILLITKSLLCPGQDSVFGLEGILWYQGRKGSSVLVADIQSLKPPARSVLQAGISFSSSWQSFCPSAPSSCRKITCYLNPLPIQGTHRSTEPFPGAGRLHCFLVRGRKPKVGQNNSQGKPISFKNRSWDTYSVLKQSQTTWLMQSRHGSPLLVHWPHERAITNLQHLFFNGQLGLLNFRKHFLRCLPFLKEPGVPPLLVHRCCVPPTSSKTLKRIIFLVTPA